MGTVAGQNRTGICGDMWESRVWGTLGQVGNSGYFDIHNLHCATYFQYLPIFVI